MSNISFHILHSFPLNLHTSHHDFAPFSLSHTHIYIIYLSVFNRAHDCIQILQPQPWATRTGGRDSRPPWNYKQTIILSSPCTKSTKSTKSVLQCLHILFNPVSTLCTTPLLFLQTRVSRKSHLIIAEQAVIKGQPYTRRKGMEAWYQAPIYQNRRPINKNKQLKTRLPQGHTSLAFTFTYLIYRGIHKQLNDESLQSSSSSSSCPGRNTGV